MMQFSFLVAGFISALTVGTASAVKLDMRLTARSIKGSVIDSCKIANDCCLSTKGACQRQSHGIVESWLQCNVGFDFCPDYGLPWSECAADCCSLATRKARACPGK